MNCGILLDNSGGNVWRCGDLPTDMHRYPFLSRPINYLSSNKTGVAIFLLLIHSNYLFKSACDLPLYDHRLCTSACPAHRNYANAIRSSPN